MRRPSFACPVITAGLLLAAPTAPFAQTGQSPSSQGDPAPAPSLTLDDIVVTASRADLPARSIGSAVTVVDRETLDRGQVRLFKDVVQDIPGLQVTTTRPGAFTQISIRGSDNDQVLVLLDGIELGDPSSTSTQYVFDHLTSLDIERIEVLRGNQSSLYGSDAIGGVINIITRRAEEDGLRFHAELEGGSYGTVNGAVSAFGRADIADFRLTAFGYRSDGPSIADPDTATSPVTEDDRYSQVGVSGRFGLRLSEALTFDVTGFVSETDLEYDSIPNDGNGEVDKDEYAVGARMTFDMLDGRLQHEVTGSLYNSVRTFSTDFSRPGGDLYDGSKTNIGYVLTGRPTDWLTIIGGVDREREWTEQVTNFSGNFDADINTNSYFGEVAIEPLPGLTFTGAARLDDNSRFGTFDTYRVTSAYLLNPIGGIDLKARASFGTGAKAPGLYQLFDGCFGNPDLEVEESTGWDVGFDLLWEEPRLQLEVTYFDNDIENEIDFGPNGEDRPGCSPRAQGYIQRGSTEAHGIELGFQMAPLDWLQISQSYTYLQSEDADTDDWLGRPRHSGSTSVTVFPLDGWSQTLRARYRTENASSRTGTTDDFVAVDLLGSYRINERVEVFGRVENLFDADYQLSYGRQTNGLSAFAGLRLNLGIDGL